MSPTRPALRWHGGKWRLAPWIIGFFPPHRVYTETFGGAGSVLLRKPTSYSEVYNDLDDEVVTLFRVLRDASQAGELIRLLTLTPFARTEWQDCYAVSENPIEIARALIVRSYMGFGSDGTNRDIKTGFRANSSRAGSTPVHDWAKYPEALGALVQRLRGVIIECRPAIDVMRSHDSADTLHYVDPPYLGETRSQKARKGGERYHVYRHEMTEADHVALLEALLTLEGMVVLSGYASPLYDRMLAGWSRHEREAMADGASPRTEVVWINPAAVAAGAVPERLI